MCTDYVHFYEFDRKENSGNGDISNILALSLTNTVISSIWQPTLAFLPGKSHGQRTLVGYNPWGHKELDVTKAT